MRGLTVSGAQENPAGDGESAGRVWTRRSALGLAAAALLPLGISVAGPGSTPIARAAFDPTGMDFWVDSSMGPIKSRVFRAADGNTNRVVYALDGMRARDDLNGWEIETNAAHTLTAANINVVMPVGGMSSFYADWTSPSTFLGIPAGTLSGTGSGAAQALAGGPGKTSTYKWETFLSQNLPAALRDRLGFSSTRNGVVGLSMSGSSALVLAAYYPSQFCYAASLSGALNLSMSGMRDAVRVAMLDAGGYNVDALAKAKDAKWQHLDPYTFAPKLKANNTRLFISAGSGLPSSADAINASTIQGMGIEAIALVGTKSFQARFNSLGGKNVVYDFPAVGVHNWKNWESEMNRLVPDLSANIG
ncbi:esterase family protein [Nocardia sp. NBC_01503]|nr:alpha/beta hydrolase family protein [Nocardia sp. NBC_01503]WTL34623.1 esterase family protein [Nocardia sp. NBC_01503]